MIYYLLIILILLFNITGLSGGDVTKSTVVLIRSVDASLVTYDLDLVPTCEFSGKISVSHPQSISNGDRHFTVGSLSLDAVVMTVDHINTKRCGVEIEGLNYSITLETYGDNSDGDKHAAIGKAIARNTNFMLGGYSSGLTQHIAPIAEKNSKILVAGGSSRTSVFANRSYAFGILPPSPTFLQGAFAGLSQLGGKTVASLSEDGASSCKSVVDYANQYGFELLATEEVTENPSDEDFDAVARNISALDPDVMVTCVYSLGCPKWIQAMRKVGWSPKAQVFTICPGSADLEVNAGSDLAYMMGASSWDRALPPVPDGATGWTPEAFASNFEQATFQPALYQHVAAATSLSVLVQAIERADTLDGSVVKDYLANGTFDTMYGRASFDQNGQSEIASLLLQYNATGGLHVVYPPDRVSSDVALVYPMPTWDNRDCNTLSKCTSTNGTCQPDGTCGCIEPLVSIGKGANAFCKDIPIEDMHYISNGLINGGFVLFAIQGILSLFFALWTLKYREMQIVRGSQPEFLILIAFGCFILASSILPVTMQGGYRYEKDHRTGTLTDKPNKNIHKLDMACMAFPWLASLGFAIVFSALFTKIMRIKKLLNNASNFRRRPVEVKDVISTMIIMVIIQIVILLIWQLIEPLHWEREVLSQDEDGYPLESWGSCRSKNAVAFLVPLGIVDAGSLIFSLWLCYITRHIPSDFAEGKWVTISITSIFQILILAIPVLIIADDNRNASFFIRAVVVFLISSTVTLLIFGPKFKRFLCPPSNTNETLEAGSEGMNVSRSQHSKRLSRSLRKFKHAERSSHSVRQLAGYSQISGLSGHEMDSAAAVQYKQEEPTA